MIYHDRKEYEVTIEDARGIQNSSNVPRVSERLVSVLFGESIVFRGGVLYIIKRQLLDQIWSKHDLLQLKEEKTRSGEPLTLSFFPPIPSR